MEMETEQNFGFEVHTPLNELNNLANNVTNEISKVIVGQNKMIKLLLTALLSDGHILLEGVPGVAKTLTAKLLSRIVDLKFSRIQFTPDLMPSDVIGTSIFHPQKGEFTFKRGPIFGNLILIDEINRAPAKTQAALFEVMEERQITVDGFSHILDSPFTVIATQNPIEQEGTYRLPEAQLDRFLFKIEIGYPTISEEINILEHHLNNNTVQLLEKVNKIINGSDIIKLRTIVQSVTVEPKLINYIATIVGQTRDNPSLYLGASPRASISILKASKSFAALMGRDFVIPEDIKFIAPHVLKHRIILTPEKEMEGLTAEALIESMLQSVEVPR